MDEATAELVNDRETDTATEPAKKEALVRQNVHRSVKNWTFTMPNLDASSRGFNVSPKVTKLVQILQCFQQAGDTFRGVVLGPSTIHLWCISDIESSASAHNGACDSRSSQNCIRADSFYSRGSVGRSMDPRQSTTGWHNVPFLTQLTPSSFLFLKISRPAYTTC